MSEDVVDTVLGRASVKTALKGSFPPDEDDLRRLVTLLDLCKSRRILEYGSGWSTLVMSLWATKNEALLESLEGDPLWYAVTKFAVIKLDDISPQLSTGETAMPMFRQEEFEPTERHRLFFSPVVSSAKGHLSYAFCCLSNPDFVYVDGPALRGNRILLGNIYEFDTSSEMAFLIDGRWPQAWAIRRRFPGYRALLSTHVSFICHPKYSDAIEWFKSNVECVVDPTSVLIED